MSSQKTRSDTILLQEDGGAVAREAIAKNKIYPGQLVEIITAAGNDLGKVQKQSTAGQNCRRAVAIEDRGQGRVIETPYEDGDRVSYVVLKPGHRYQAKIGDDNIGLGIFLQAASGGRMEARAGTGTAIAIAMKAVDNSAVTDDTDANQVFIPVESM